MLKLALIGWGLNVLAFIAHGLWADKDPTHEDVVITGLLIFCLVPYFVAVLEAIEFVKQKIFHIHHGVKRK